MLAGRRQKGKTKDPGKEISSSSSVARQPLRLLSWNLEPCYSTLLSCSLLPPPTPLLRHRTITMTDETPAAAMSPAAGGEDRNRAILLLFPARPSPYNLQPRASQENESHRGATKSLRCAPAKMSALEARSSFAEQ